MQIDELRWTTRYPRFQCASPNRNGGMQWRRIGTSRCVGVLLPPFNASSHLLTTNGGQRAFRSHRNPGPYPDPLLFTKNEAFVPFIAEKRRKTTTIATSTGEQMLCLPTDTPSSYVRPALHGCTVTMRYNAGEDRGFSVEEYNPSRWF